MNLAFVFSPELVAGRPMDFTRLWTDPRGMTGSESGILIFAREMAKRGHGATMYIPSPNAPAYDDVQVRDISELAGAWDSFDVITSWIYPAPFENKSAKPLRVLSQQCNSFDYAHLNFEDDVDLFIAPSVAQRDFVRNWTPISYGKWHVLGNGVYIGDYGLCPKVPGRVVHTSSCDRGLHLLLQEWNAIRAAVPHAHLKIFYHSLDRLIREAGKVPQDSQTHTIDNVEMGCRARYLERMIQPGVLEGVEVVGSSSRETMRRELSEAQVLAYPCDTIAWTEGFSVSTLEGCASGALPIISAADALGSIYSGVCPMVPAPARKHMADWRQLVIRALTDEPWRVQMAERARGFAINHDWGRLAFQMEKLFERGLAEKRRAPPPVWTSSERIPIDFVLSPFAGGEDPISPETFADESRGGGSRAGFMRLVNEMTRVMQPGGTHQYLVRGFARLTHENGTFRQYDTFDKNDASRKALFAYYDTSPLRGVDTGCLRIASHHTYLPPDVWFSARSELNVAPSQHAVDALRGGFDPKGKWYVLPNGVEHPPIVHQPVAGRVVHHASPDRGLHLLLKCWPIIRAAVPHATLHVIGDVSGGGRWNDAPLFPSFQRTPQGARIMQMRGGLREAQAAGGVNLLGRVSRAQLHQELGQAACFAFPCSVLLPCETFSVSVMECCAAGIPVVLAPSDALGEVYRGIAELTPAPVEEHLPEFADAVIAMLKSVPRQLFHKYLTRRYASKYTFARMGHILDQIVRENLTR